MPVRRSPAILAVTGAILVSSALLDFLVAVRPVWLRNALPKGPNGKILKRQIHLPDAEAAR